MALFFNNPRLTSSSLSSFPFLSPPSQLKSPIPKQFSVRSVSGSNENGNKSDGKESSKPKKRLSEQSSWEAKDSEGEDYLYRLGKEADNMNIAVGARAGVIDDLFAGNFLGRDCECFFFRLSSVWFLRKCTRRRLGNVVRCRLKDTFIYF